MMKVLVYKTFSTEAYQNSQNKMLTASLVSVKSAMLLKWAVLVGKH